MSIKGFTTEDLVSRPEEIAAALEEDGVVKVLSFHTLETVNHLCELLRSCMDNIRDEVGEVRLTRAGEAGVVRVPLKFHREFLDMASDSRLLRIIERFVGASSILHLQNGFILKPTSKQLLKSTEVFQGKWHRDFPRFTGPIPLSVNAFHVLSDFSSETGATEFIPKSHLSNESLDSHLKKLKPVVASGSPGDVLLFDSTIWHRAGVNQSDADRLAVNNQYTFSWMKQQLDLPRLLGEPFFSDLSERQEQLLGRYTRVPAAYDEFYTAPEDRLYRGGQG